mmetsp:Transcript_107499/g.284900  ORF Transcript_107499/g.284900 Transcript_107499/m.284900 type:complete len:240 (+) Transcript_107499:232-951(+)
MSLHLLCTSNSSPLLVVEFGLLALMAPRSLQLLWRLQGRLRHHQRNGLLHLDRWNLGQVSTGETQRRRFWREVGIRELVEFVHQLGEQGLRFRLLLVVFHLAVRLVPEQLRLVLLGIDVAQADAALLEVEGLDDVLPLHPRPLGGRQIGLPNHVVEGLVPNALPDHGVDVEVRVLRHGVASCDILEQALLRVLRASAAVQRHGRRILGAAAREGGHGLVQVHLQQGVQRTLPRVHLALH